MKKLTIATYLRPALPQDVFDQKGAGRFFENREYFFKNADGSITGPTVINIPTKRVDYYRNYQNELDDVKDVEKRYHNLILEYYNFMSLDKLYIVDRNDIETSIPIHLKIKEAIKTDIYQFKKLINNKVFFMREGKAVQGPFYITTKQFLYEFENLIETRSLFVFDKSSEIKVVKELKKAQAV